MGKMHCLKLGKHLGTYSGTALEDMHVGRSCGCWLAVKQTVSPVQAEAAARLQSLIAELRSAFT
jgi:hypothetical protein